jgi:hypothetical protein
MWQPHDIKVQACSESEEDISNSGAGLKGSNCPNPGQSIKINDNNGLLPYRRK